MDALRNPVGELPPEVYWRRRIVTFGFIGLVLIVFFYLIKGSFTTATNPSPSLTTSADANPAVTASPRASVGTSPAVATAAACVPGDITLDLAAVERHMVSPAAPAFAATFTQKGATNCAIDTGASGVELLVTSGPDRVWSSLDCETPLTVSVTELVLTPNKPATITVTWPGIRSNPTCSSSLPEPLPGTYRAVLTMGGVTSPQAPVELTD